MDWQREMCGEVCRMDDRIAVVDDQGGWDVFDLGMNRLDGGEESDIETAKTRCEAWSKTSMCKRSIYYHTGDPMLDDLEFTSDDESEWASDPSYSTGWWVPNVTLTVQSGDGGETWDWVVEDRNTYPPTHLIGQGFPDIAAALIDFKRSVQGRFGYVMPRESARNSQASMSKQSSLASPSGNIYVNVDDASAPYKRAIRDAVNVSPILDVYAMVYGPSWAYATAYMTYDYADPAVSNAYDKPTAWGWCIFDNWGPASNPTIISVSGPEFKTFASAASELERAMDESPIGEHTSQNFANSPRVPEEVDSKDDQPCPLCGSDHFDGKHCQTCGYDVAPDGLNDIDIDDLDEVEDVDDGNDDNDGDGATDETPVEDE